MEKGLQSIGLRPLERSNLIIKENDYNPDNSEVSLNMKPESESWEPETITNKASAFAFYSETFDFFFQNEGIFVQLDEFDELDKIILVESMKKHRAQKHRKHFSVMAPVAGI